MSSNPQTARLLPPTPAELMAMGYSFDEAHAVRMPIDPKFKAFYEMQSRPAVPVITWRPKQVRLID